MTDFYMTAWYALPVLLAVAALLAVAWLAEIVLTNKAEREAREDVEDAQFNHGVPAGDVKLDITVNETTWLFWDPSFVDGRRKAEPSSFRDSDAYTRALQALEDAKNARVARTEVDQVNWDKVWDILEGGAA